MITPPNVTVLVAVYNGMDYLRPALDSVLAQSYHQWELIIINDGSTDETPHILDDYARCDDRIVVVHQSNAGQTHALNTGLKISRGQYIARLDADDILLSSRLAQQVSYLDSHPEIGLLGSAVDLIDETGIAYCTLQPPSCDRELRRVLIQRNPFVHSSVMFRRELLDVVGYYDPRYQPAQDYDLWMRVAQKCQLANLPEVLVKLRKYVGNMSSNHYKRQARETLEIQLKAVRSRWYPWWSVIYFWRSIFYLFMPAWVYRLVIKNRRIRYHWIEVSQF